MACRFVAVCTLMSTAVLSWNCLPASAQDSATQELTQPINSTSVDTTAKVVRWSGTLPPSAGKTVQLRFAIFENASGGLALWSESQAVTVGSDGRYSVLLGATNQEGLPQTLFPAGESRWIEARTLDSLATPEPERAGAPRTLIAAVPYAFHSMDASALGGRSASDYLTREDLQSAAVAGSSAFTSPSAAGVQPNITGTGTTNYLPIWTSSTAFGNSTVYETSNNVGIGTTVPGATLDVNGTANFRGTTYLPAIGAATASTGYSSRALQFGASSYSSYTKAAVPQAFQWQAIPTSNNTTTPAANLSLLYGIGTTTPAATGLSIASTGKITFASGQTFPGTGDITSVAVTSPLTGGGTTGALTIGLSTTTLETTLNTKYAQLAAANAFTSSATFAGQITGNDTGTDYAVEGKTAAGAGVKGYATGTNGFGILGQSLAANGIGLFGNNAALSSIGTMYRGYGFGAGVWADTNLSYASAPKVASVATADDNYAQLDYNNSTGADTVVIYNFNSTTGAPAAKIGGYHGACYFDNGGSFSCDGTKSAMVPVDNNTRKVALYAVESPENWFEDFGSGKLAAGSAKVQFEPTFAQTVNVGIDYKVFLTPKGDCKGLYVTNETATGFEVRELGGGQSTVVFDYRIIAKRKGYETVRMADKTKYMSPSPMPRKLAAKAASAAK